MKPSFSLKWLFVGIALSCLVLAVPLTVISERKQAEAFHRRTMYAASLLRGSGIGLKGYAENVTHPDGQPGIELEGAGGEVTEEIAKRLVDSGFAYVVLYDSRLTDDARREMDSEFDCNESFFGPNTMIVFRRRHVRAPLGLGHVYQATQ